jgi:hypothetical protein
MGSFSDDFKFGLCEGLNLNPSSCASHFESVNLPLQDVAFLAISTVFSADSERYNPYLTQNGGQPLNYVEIKYGYLLDMTLFFAGIILIPELSILIHKYL